MDYNELVWGCCNVFWMEFGLGYELGLDCGCFELV